MTVPNVGRPQVESHGAGQRGLRRRRRRVQMITAMPYWSGETYDNLFHPASDSTEGIH